MRLVTRSPHQETITLTACRGRNYKFHAKLSSWAQVRKNPLNFLGFAASFRKKCPRFFEISLEEWRDGHTPRYQNDVKPYQIDGNLIPFVSAGLNTFAR